MYLNLIFNLFFKLADLADSKAGQTCNLHGGGFFFLPSWSEYLHGTYNGLGECSTSFTPPGDFFLIGLAILDALIRVAGFAAVVSIIIAGIQYIIAIGNAEKITNARRRIIYALSGLAIALVATAVVGYIGRVFGA